ncbi:hypothetical protein [Cohnella herbarum]|uniref:Uncharacterized protein n=1 Tax=Cohnella herbarum TaxID=2728023 RepID=A0A7Z2VJB6_9BACL|nr:hypothetical protein [Cohnella herbarum]QJD84253.1 hypothetical protein HH215_14345 [Cohnella herbarum]
MEYLKFFTSSAFIIGAIVYLGKVLISNLINRDVERFKSELVISANQHQITFTKLHNERADVIKELYARLVRVVRIMEDLCSNPTSQKADEAIPLIIDLKYFFEERRIYFDSKVSMLIEEVVMNIHNGYFELSYNADHNIVDIMDEEIKKQTFSSRLEGWNKIKRKVPELKESLENDFRSLLGTIKQ